MKKSESKTASPNDQRPARKSSWVLPLIALTLGLYWAQGALSEGVSSGNRSPGRTVGRVNRSPVGELPSSESLQGNLPGVAPAQDPGANIKPLMEQHLAKSEGYSGVYPAASAIVPIQADIFRNQDGLLQVRSVDSSGPEAQAGIRVNDTFQNWDELGQVLNGGANPNRGRGGQASAANAQGDMPPSSNGDHNN